VPGPYGELAADGYAFAFQDIRGTNRSEGQFLMNRPLRPVGDTAGTDRAAIDDPATGIKATGADVSAEARERLVAAATWCVAQWARAIVLGCTEISVGMAGTSLGGVELVDPLALAAAALLDVAYGRREPETLRRTERA
jgi:hypothetical protein